MALSSFEFRWRPPKDAPFEPNLMPSYGEVLELRATKLKTAKIYV